MIYIAHKTLAAIKQAIEADQGASYRKLLRETMPTAEDAYKEDVFPFRSHLGASRIGAECARELWYEFRWATRAKHSDGMLRLFNRGHLEEPRFVAMLGAAGIKVHQFTEQGKQYQIALYGGHFGGSLDGVAERIPERESPVLCEMKTHNAASFAKLAGRNWNSYFAEPDKHPFQGEGVRSSKFRHYVQMQMYMRAYRLDFGLYLAVCKDDDALYAELVGIDEAISDAFSNRAREIIFATEPPARIKNDPTWYQCRFCNQAPVCYGKKQAERNCRTCEHSKPTPDGAWHCMSGDFDLNKQMQLDGCSLYQLRKL